MSAVPPAQRKRQVQSSIADCVTSVIDILGRDTSDEAMVLGDNVLIGQTILEKLDLLVDCANQRVLPNPAHPDQPVLHVR
jgi:hypothetical protein